MFDRLNEEQILSVYRAARPLHPSDHDAFFAAVAKELDGQEIGDGMLHRCIAAVQGRFVKAPVTGD